MSYKMLHGRLVQQRGRRHFAVENPLYVSIADRIAAQSQVKTNLWARIESNWAKHMRARVAHNQHS